MSPLRWHIQSCICLAGCSSASVLYGFPFLCPELYNKGARPREFFSSPLCLITENIFTWISESKIHESSVCVVYHQILKRVLSMQ